MPRSLRIQFSGAFYHIFNRGVAKQWIVQDQHDRRIFFSLLSKTIQTFPIRLFAYCLMDNHFHFFLQIQRRILDQAMHCFGSQFVRFINHRYDRVGPLYQGRYKSRLVNTERYAFTLTRYIHQNPLDSNIVTRLEDYPWSSYPCYTGQSPTWSWLDTHWLLNQFHTQPSKSVQVFRKFHRKKPSRAEHARLSDFRKKLD